ncbi:MAG: hypothetical protein AAFV07_03365, partial [Bacteroidota bacterium]
SVSALEGFLDEYPDSEFEEEAQELLADIRDIKIAENFAEGGQFEYRIQYAKAPLEFTVAPEEGLAYDWDEENELFSASISDNQPYSVKVTDSRGKTVFFELDASVPPIQISAANFVKAESGNTESVTFTVQGGLPPYILVLQPGDNDGQEIYLENIPALETAGPITLSLEQLETAAGAPLATGSYELMILDKRKTQLSGKPVAPMKSWDIVAKEESEGEFPVIPLILGALVLVVVLALVLGRKKKKEEADPHRQALQERERQETETRRQQEERSRSEAAKPQEKSIVPPVRERAIPPERPRTSTIRVTSRKTIQDVPKRPFVADTAPIGTYFAFDLTEHWPESAVHTIYLHRDSIAKLDDFIQEENVAMIEEAPDSIPEIGGFLLGNFKPTGTGGQYLVALEKFVPITPEEQGVYKVEFGEAAWGELDNVMTENPDLYNIGWFHTHPGHSLFLSQPDIRIHSGFFREKYQVAMEVDTLTPGLDTAFFTRRPDGEINNTKDRMPGTDWFHWQWVIDWMRAQNVSPRPSCVRALESRLTDTSSSLSFPLYAFLSYQPFPDTQMKTHATMTFLSTVHDSHQTSTYQ